MAWLQTEYEMSLFDRRMTEQQHGEEKLREIVAHGVGRKLQKIMGTAFASTAEEQPARNNGVVFRQHFLFVPGQEWAYQRNRLQALALRMRSLPDIEAREMAHSIQHIIEQLEAVPEAMAKMLDGHKEAPGV